MCQARLNRGHHFKGADGATVRLMVNGINADLLSGRLTIEQAKKEKDRILKLVEISHQPVIANLFLI